MWIEFNSRAVRPADSLAPRDNAQRFRDTRKESIQPRDRLDQIFAHKARRRTDGANGLVRRIDDGQDFFAQHFCEAPNFPDQDN